MTASVNPRHNCRENVLEVSSMSPDSSEIKWHLPFETFERGYGSTSEKMLLDTSSVIRVCELPGTEFYFEMFVRKVEDSKFWYSIGFEITKNPNNLSPELCSASVQLGTESYYVHEDLKLDSQRPLDESVLKAKESEGILEKGKSIIVQCEMGTAQQIKCEAAA